MTPLSRAARPEAPRTTNSRERIRQIAAKLFTSRGFHATTMDDLAAGVGVNKATVYYYFRSKSDILYDIYDQGIEIALDGVRGVADDIPADVALATLIRYHVNTIVKHGDIAGVYFQEARWLPQWLSRPQLCAIRDKEAEYTDFVNALIERGVKEGTLQTEDPRIATFAIVGMLGWIHQWLRPRGRLTSDEVADLLISFAFDGLRHA
jgi:AcrR family transcriptional regulator